MRDEGLSRAIEVIGGISALARGLGVAQPSVSNWSRIPADRVLAVEALTKVPRGALRPDLYPDDRNGPAFDVLDQARATIYLLLAGLLIRVPDERALARIAALSDDESAFGRALGALRDAAQQTEAAAVAREYFDLFVGVGRGELLPFASYYLTGFLYERPLVRIRQDMTNLGLSREDDVHEPEDHIGVLCEVMAGLAGGTFAAPAGSESRFFEKHLAPWAEKFFSDLANADSARFYPAVGRLGRLFMALERDGFALDDDAGGTNRPARERSDA